MLMVFEPEFRFKNGGSPLISNFLGSAPSIRLNY